MWIVYRGRVVYTMFCVVSQGVEGNNSFVLGTSLHIRLSQIRLLRPYMANLI